MINKEFFDFQVCRGSMNSVPVHCGVITNNQEKGEKMMDYIISLFDKDDIFQIKKSNINPKIDIVLNNGVRIMYVPASPSIKGYRFMKAIIDKDVSAQEWCDICGTLLYANGEDGDIIRF